MPLWIFALIGTGALIWYLSPSSSSVTLNNVQNTFANFRVINPNGAKGYAYVSNVVALTPVITIPNGTTLSALSQGTDPTGVSYYSVSFNGQTYWVIGTDLMQGQ